MITIYILTSEFGSSPCCDRNNPQWLRKQEKVGGEVFVSPLDSFVADYFHASFIKPLLDDDGYIMDKYLGALSLISKDGISYCIKKWHKNQYKESFTKNKELWL